MVNRSHPYMPINDMSYHKYDVTQVVEETKKVIDSICEDNDQFGYLLEIYKDSRDIEKMDRDTNSYGDIRPRVMEQLFGKLITIELGNAKKRGQLPDKAIGNLLQQFRFQMQTYCYHKYCIPSEYNSLENALNDAYLTQ
jgi:hypothetical protein